MADDYKHLNKEEVELVKNVVVEVHELKKEEEAESDEEMIITEKEKDKDIEEVDDKIKKTLGSLEKLAVADEDEKNRRRTELVLMTLLEAEKLRKVQPSEDAKEDTKSGSEENRKEHTKEDGTEEGATGSTKDTKDDDAKEGTNDTKKDNLEEIRTGRNENEADQKTLESIRKTIFTGEKKSGNTVELVRATIMEAAKIRKVSEMKSDDEAVETAPNKTQMQETKSIKTDTISKINEETEHKIELVRTTLQETQKLEKFEIREIKKENPEQVEKVTINENQEKEEVNSIKINQASNFSQERNTEQTRKVIPKEMLAERLKKHDYEEINELKERKSTGAKTVLQPAVKSNLNKSENDTVEQKDSIKNSDDTETAQKKKKKKKSGKRDCQII